MAKHLIDVDEDRLGAARAELGTTTIRTPSTKLSPGPQHDASDAWRARWTCLPLLTSKIAPTLGAELPRRHQRS
jgi:hypothetical protein